VPIRIEIGPKDVTNKKVTVCRRDRAGSKETVDRSVMVTELKNRLEVMQSDMLEAARAKTSPNKKFALNFDEFMIYLNERCVIMAPHCDDTKCEEKIKVRSAEESKKNANFMAETASFNNNSNSNNNEETVAPLTGAAKSLCIPFDQPTLKDDTVCFHCGAKAKHWTLFGRSY